MEPDPAARTALYLRTSCSAQRLKESASPRERRHDASLSKRLLRLLVPLIVVPLAVVVVIVVAIERRTPREDGGYAHGHGAARCCTVLRKGVRGGHVSRYSMETASCAMAGVRARLARRRSQRIAQPPCGHATATHASMPPPRVHVTCPCHRYSRVL